MVVLVHRIMYLQLGYKMPSPDHRHGGSSRHPEVLYCPPYRMENGAIEKCRYGIDRLIRAVTLGARSKYQVFPDHRFLGTCTEYSVPRT